MPPLISMGAMMMCSFGVAPVPFDPLPVPGKTMMDEMLGAGIDEIIPIENVATFGMCNSPANPEVIAATAAALGVFTPMPCVPVIVAPWDPPSAVVMFDEIPAATIECTCECAWGGVISIDSPSETVMQDDS